MKKIFVILAFIAFSAGAFARDYSAADVNNCLSDLSIIMNKTLPNAASQQNVYSQAWIGKVFPSAPPHFAVGLEAGVTKLDLSPLGTVAEIFKVGSLPNTFIYPTITGNVRVGGFFLPFDFGFSCMYMNFSKLKAVSDGFGVKFFDIGGDVRYALLKGEGALPQISLGLGYYYLGGKISLDKDGVSAGIEYATHTLFGQVQVSKTFLFFTPFIGFRGIFSKSDTKWNWAVTNERIASAASYIGTETSGSGSEKASWTDCFIPQIYGGFGIKASFFALNLSGSYDFKHSIWNGNLSMRFQM